jgi:hypothetical protein
MFSRRAITMSMHEALVKAMHLPDDNDTVRHLHEGGLAIASVDTMSQAIHDVYCGLTPDHDHPSDKDRAQAAAMISALQKHATEGAPA